MKSIYTYYKERLLEISGKNRSLYSKKLSNKYAYDIGEIFGKDTEILSDFLNFLWKGKRDSFTVIGKDNKEKVFSAFGLDQKIKDSFNDERNMTAEEKRNENLRRERLRRDEGKKMMISQVTRLKNLKRDVEEFSKETGRYEMFVGYPFVTGYVNKELSVKAPLILFPVVINVESETEVSIELKHGECVQFNKVLLLAIAKEERINCDEIMTEFDNLIDYKLKDVSSVLEYLNSFGFKFKIEDNFNKGFVKFSNLKDDFSRYDGFRVVNSCVIGRFPLANAIYNDYAMLEKRHLTSDAIDQLISGKTIKKNKKFDKRVFTINDLDYAQENAISKLNEQGNIVIYGPPGTGKSQTIVNIISDALCKNKRVLVVSQKKAALDVVFNRLKNLNSKCMFVTDAEKNKVEFYEKCSRMHTQLVENWKPTKHEEFAAVENSIEKEVEELETISNTLFGTTEFGISLQEMYANSAKIGKNSFDYVIYKQMLKNNKIMQMDYKSLFSTLRVINEKNKSSLYYRYIELKKTNPLVDHIKPDLDIHIINQMKAHLNSMIKENVIPFDTAKFPHCRQYLAFAMRDECDEMEDMKPIVKIIAKMENPKLYENLNTAKVVLPLYPFAKRKVEMIEDSISAEFEQIATEIEEYVQNYDLFEKVLDRKGFLMTLDNIVDGNLVFLKLLASALENYVEIRDINFTLQSLTEEERVILNFAYKNSNSVKQYKEIIEKLLEIRIYHEAIYYEEQNKEKLSKIIDFENVRNRILSLKQDEKMLSNEICLDKFKEEYLELFKNGGTASKDYLYQITKQQGLLPIRKMMELYGDYVLKLFPCWLLSPESVSTIFPLKRNLFDLILFDEASQVFIENTIPTIYRGKNIVIAGDSKQLRPTSTFMKRYMGNDSEDDLDVTSKAALEVESLLDLATSRYASTNLTYHYRSRNEELINFSNYAFYDGKLQISPNISKNVANKPIERIKVNGHWEGRKNVEEANAIVALLKKLIKNKKNKSSIGIITFNSEQESAIEDAIDKECLKDDAFRDAYVKELNRKDNGEDVSLFVKNLENVQGDERDIIIFSIGYARNEFGKVVAHFGPLSVEGGENRLNVAITRAKQKIYVVTSIEPEELMVEGTKNAGPKFFKSYLKYVRAISNRKNKEAELILNTFKPVHEENKQEIVANRLENQIKDELVKLGYDVETNLGNTDYKISLAVYDKKRDRYLLGIECDYAAYASSDSILERDVYRNKFLASRGWKIMRVWSRDWWLNKQKVISSIVKEISNEKKRLQSAGTSTSVAPSVTLETSKAQKTQKQPKTDSTVKSTTTKSVDTKKANNVSKTNNTSKAKSVNKTENVKKVEKVDKSKKAVEVAKKPIKTQNKEATKPATKQTKPTSKTPAKSANKTTSKTDVKTKAKASVKENLNVKSKPAKKSK